MKVKHLMTATLLTAVLFVHASGRAEGIVEQYARTAATGANDAYKRNLPDDGVTRSAKAYSDGKTLVHEYVLGIRQDAAEKELAAWRAGTRSDVVPKTCAALKNDDFFQKRGFQIRYRYLDQNSKVLDDFKVNKPACSAYGF